MIWFIVTEPRAKARANAKFHAAKYVLEDCADEVCLELDYSSVSRRLFDECRPWAIVHSGGPTPIGDHDILQSRGYIECVKDWAVSQFAICKGMQLVSVMHGSSVSTMRKLAEGEPDSDPSYYGGHFKEQGFLEVNALKRDPLFKGLPETLIVDQNHAEEVKSLPAGFELLGSSAACRMQAIRRLSGPPLYAVQFHPERSDESHNHGFKILRNFFKIAKEWNLRRTS